MVDARLRRLCEKKPSGKLNVPQSIHDQWMAGGKQRDELRALLEQFDFDKEPFLWTHLGDLGAVKKSACMSHVIKKHVWIKKKMLSQFDFSSGELQ